MKKIEPYYVVRINQSTHTRLKTYTSSIGEKMQDTVDDLLNEMLDKFDKKKLKK